MISAKLHFFSGYQFDLIIMLGLGGYFLQLKGNVSAHSGFDIQSADSLAPGATEL